jgi:glucose/arabinose dehydrogenase
MTDRLKFISSRAGLLILGFHIGLSASSTAIAGALQRVPNTTLTMATSPPVFSGYALTNAFGGLVFLDPVAIVTPPGNTNRIFVVERGGTIAVITNLATPDRTVFLDISDKIIYAGEGGLLSLVFHPNYASNGLFYVWYYGLDTTVSFGAHEVLACYQVSSDNPNFADPATEVRLVRQRDLASNHNGGTVAFGTDGYLYFSMGDEGGAYDLTFNNSQRIDKDFFSGMMRIDVDKKPGGLPPNPHPSATTNYAVPPDNPFIGATSFNGAPVDPGSVRTEFWAVGLRNPFRWSFDRSTGRIFLGDVGQNQYEEVNVVAKGGNYGWNYRDGYTTGFRTAPAGFTSIDPILVYNHGPSDFTGNAVIGGLVYRGAGLSQLSGSYLFADNVYGNVWKLDYSGAGASNWTRIAGADGPTSFGTDPRNGDVLISIRSMSGLVTSQPLQRLVYNGGQTGIPLPPTLADTGVFADVTTLAPNPGVIAYDVNVPSWCDGAVTRRWFSVPDTNQTIGFSASGSWVFPAGTVWIQHLDLQTNSSPPMSMRVETRVLVRNANGVYGATYRWGGSTSNATLVPEGGMDEMFVVRDDGGPRLQVWHYPSWSECAACHNELAGYAVGFNTAQLNRNYNYAGTVTNQIKALSDAGYFNAGVSGIHTLPGLAWATNAAVSREYRVRSFLAANCAQCHQPGGAAGLSSWDARITTPTSLAGIINGFAVGDLGNPVNRIIKPGSPATSVMYSRLAIPGPNHMPPLATSVVNTQAVELLADWITNDLATYQSFADWQLARFGSTNAPGTQASDDFDHDGAVNYLEYLTATDPTNAASKWTINFKLTGGQATLTFPEAANRAFELQSAPGLMTSNNWTPLNVPGNEPFFSSTNHTANIQFSLPPGTGNYYRVRVIEP